MKLTKTPIFPNCQVPNGFFGITVKFIIQKFFEGTYFTHIPGLSYKSVNQFWLNLPHQRGKTFFTSNFKNVSHLQMDIFCYFNFGHCRRNAFRLTEHSQTFNLHPEKLFWGWSPEFLNIIYCINPAFFQGGDPNKIRVCRTWNLSTLQIFTGVSLWLRLDYYTQKMQGHR